MGEVASPTRLLLYTSAPVLSSKKWGFSMKSQQIMREPQNSNFNSCGILYYISPPLSRENQYFQEFSIKISWTQFTNREPSNFGFERLHILQNSNMMESVWVLLAFMLTIILAQVVANASKWERVIFIGILYHSAFNPSSIKQEKSLSILSFCKSLLHLYLGPPGTARLDFVK